VTIQQILHYAVGYCSLVLVISCPSLKILNAYMALSYSRVRLSRLLSAFVDIEKCERTTGNHRPSLLPPLISERARVFAERCQVREPEFWDPTALPAVIIENSMRMGMERPHAPTTRRKRWCVTATAATNDGKGSIGPPHLPRTIEVNKFVPPIAVRDCASPRMRSVLGCRRSSGSRRFLAGFADHLTY